MARLVETLLRYVRVGLGERVAGFAALALLAAFALGLLLSLLP